MARIERYIDISALKNTATVALNESALHYKIDARPDCVFELPGGDANQNNKCSDKEEKQ